MEEYASNSFKSKQPPAVQQNQSSEKKVESVVSGSVKKQKQSRFQKFASAIVQDDAKTIGSYIFEDILVPAAKRLIHDSVDAVLYPNGGPKGHTNTSRVSYKSYYDRDRDDRRGYRNTRAGAYDFDKYVIPNRGEAEEVIRELLRIARRYDGIASVADYYDLLGVNDSNYTNNRYGWTETDIAEAYVKPAHGEPGYVVVLPKALPID